MSNLAHVILLENLDKSKGNFHHAGRPGKRGGSVRMGGFLVDGRDQTNRPQPRPVIDVTPKPEGPKAKSPDKDVAQVRKEQENRGIGRKTDRRTDDEKKIAQVKNTLLRRGVDPRTPSFLDDYHKALWRAGVSDTALKEELEKTKARMTNNLHKSINSTDLLRLILDL